MVSELPAELQLEVFAVIGVDEFEPRADVVAVEVAGHAKFGVKEE